MSKSKIKMTKTAMIREMLKLEILDEPNAKTMARRLYWEVERTYNEVVPRRKAWLAGHGERE